MINSALNLFANIKASTVAVFAIILAFLMPILPLILIVGAAIALDTIFGILRARKLKEPVTSRKLSKIISKMVLYQSAIVLFFCIEKYVIGDFLVLITSIPLVLTKLVTVVLLYIEILSVGENYKAVSGISIWDKFKHMVSRTKEVKQLLTELKGSEENDKHI